MTSRRYWVISPNVLPKKHMVDEWRNASLRCRAAFIGWDTNSPLGHKFAYDIRPGDIILIARRYKGEPETVGFGKVVNRFKTRVQGFDPPEEFHGSLRQLSPFMPWSRADEELPFLDAVNQTAAIHMLHPEKVPSHKVLCDWMDEKLAARAARRYGKRTRNLSSPITFGELPNDRQLEYRVITRKASTVARKTEAELVARYRAWLGRQNRVLEIFKSDEIKCDAYEKSRRNLIEAKCSGGRAYIRMAVGQLLDYSFQVKEKLGKCEKAILLPAKPDENILEWLGSIGIKVIWEERNAFLDNANGQFI